MILSDLSVLRAGMTVLRKSDWFVGLSCLLVALFVWWGSGCEALAAARVIKYLQVEANEGDSSGGHTAIRFDAETFHFQHDSSGIIRIKRLDSKTFDHSYAMLGNRTIRESWIAVSADTYTLLLDGFNEILIIQDEQLNILASLHRDVELFEFLLQRVQGLGSAAKISSLRLKGIGYFLADEPLHPGPITATDAGLSHDIRPISQSLKNLKSHIQSVYGETYIEKRIAETKAAIRKIKLQAVKLRLPAIAPDIYPVSALSASTAYEDALLNLFALELLLVEPKLLQGSYLLPVSNLFQLAPEENLLLRAFANKLESDLLRLANSSRSDWGFSFIVGMARLASLEASLSTGSYVFLDVIPATAQQQSLQPFTGCRYLPAIKSELEESFQRRRQAFVSSTDMRESDYSVLELLGNSLIEIEQAIAKGVKPRDLQGTTVPARKSLRRDFVIPDMNEVELKQELEAARAAENEYAAALSSLYSYDLFRRNCVTEIFASINKSFARLSVANGVAGQSRAINPVESAKSESLQRLGGYVDAARGFTFIPVMSAREVAAYYSVTATYERLSYRAARLAEMKMVESPLLVFLRESNTITSTVYQPSPNDSPFLFFTDDTLLLRPIFGAFNLLIGFSESLLGIVTIPVEGPRRLYLGAKGMLFSLPELFFVNVRKGSLEYVAEIR